MKTDYTLEWLDFWNYELTKKIEELKEKLEKRKKELGSENANEFNE